MNELIMALLLFCSGMGAIHCGLTAWYLTTPAGRLYWDKMQRIRAQRKIVCDWLNGKSKT